MRHRVRIPSQTEMAKYDRIIYRVDTIVEITSDTSVDRGVPAEVENQYPPSVVRYADVDKEDPANSKPAAPRLTRPSTSHWEKY